MSTEKLYPIPENIGKDCKFWNLAGTLNCDFLSAKLEGRTSCEGIIDDMCLFQQGKIPPPAWLSRKQVIWLVTTPPSEEYTRAIPPGRTTI